MHTPTSVRAACLLLVLSGGVPSMSGCSDQTKETGTQAPAMSPTDLKEMEQSQEVYRTQGQGPGKKK